MKTRHQFRREIHRNDALEILATGKRRVEASADVRLVHGCMRRAPERDRSDGYRSLDQRSKRSSDTAARSAVRLPARSDALFVRRDRNEHQRPTIPPLRGIPKCREQWRRRARSTAWPAASTLQTFESTSDSAAIAAVLCRRSTASSIAAAASVRPNLIPCVLTTTSNRRPALHADQDRILSRASSASSQIRQTQQLARDRDV